MAKVIVSDSDYWIRTVQVAKKQAMPEKQSLPVNPLPVHKKPKAVKFNGYAVVEMKGGAGSGNWGHRGVPGQRGGSAGGAGGSGGAVELDAHEYLKAHNYEVNPVDWIKDHFEFAQPIDNWAGRFVNQDLVKTRDMYVAQDDKTTSNNRKLREGKSAGIWTKRVDEYVQQASFKRDSIVYRGLALPDEFITNLKSQMRLKDNGFCSTSGKSTALAYMAIRQRNTGTSNVLFKLTARAGSKVGVMDSGEYVLPRGSTFIFNSYSIVDGVHVFVGDVE